MEKVQGQHSIILERLSTHMVVVVVVEIEALFIMLMIVMMARTGKVVMIAENHTLLHLALLALVELPVMVQMVQESVVVQLVVQKMYQ